MVIFHSYVKIPQGRFADYWRESFRNMSEDHQEIRADVGGRDVQTKDFMSVLSFCGATTWEFLLAKHL